LRVAAEHLVPERVLAIRGGSGAPRVALTFDDGPGPSTRAYLDVLDRHRVRATFFLIGAECAGRADDVLEIVRRGHQVANHSYSHRRFPTLSNPEIEHELVATEALLPLTSGDRPMVRPPQGDTSLRSLVVCALAGYRTVLWSLDSDDARVRDPVGVVDRVSPGRVSAGEIVLLHEGQPWTLAALPPIFERLRGAGFELCTVAELLE
jgi:peptidoglycan/xylan/chitin deacetylase (PgdA/CDA1 family)